jgi:hypothetical protein
MTLTLRRSGSDRSDAMLGAVMLILLRALAVVRTLAPAPPGFFFSVPLSVAERSSSFFVVRRRDWDKASSRPRVVLMDWDCMEDRLAPRRPHGYPEEEEGVSR